MCGAVILEEAVMHLASGCTFRPIYFGAVGK